MNAELRRAPRNARLCLAAALAAAACRVNAAEPMLAKDLSIAGRSYRYAVYRESLPGMFLFTPRVQREGKPKGVLAALDSGGEIVFSGEFGGMMDIPTGREELFRGKDAVMLTDFKRLAPGLYGYFAVRLGGDPGGGPCWRFSKYHFLDKDFQETAGLPSPDDPDLDGHDVIVKKNGNLVFQFYREDRETGLIDVEFQELTSSGSVVFSWNSKDHMLRPPAGGSGVADYVHANSIAEDADGGLIVSLAHICEVAKISSPGGEVLWRMSGRNWKFRNDPLRGFCNQHTATRLPNGNILMFDNGGGWRGDVSRVVEYSIDPAAREAALVWEYRPRPGEPSRPILGSAQRLSNGNTLIGWGGFIPDRKAAAQRPAPRPLPFFTEVDPAGNVVRELTALDGQVSYRVWFAPAP